MQTNDTVAASVTPFFLSYRTEQAALSPDGRYLAFDEYDGAHVAIRVTDLADRSARRIELSDQAKTRAAVVQLKWISPTRLAFALRNGALGSIEAKSGTTTRILNWKDLKNFLPVPEVGVRREFRAPTPDMPGDGGRSASLTTAVIETDVRFALANSHAGSDLLAPGSGDNSRYTLAPFVLGVTSGDQPKLLVEVRTDRDLTDDFQDEVRELVLPADVALQNPFGFDPDYGQTLGYGMHRIRTPQPPNVILEIDLDTRRRRVVEEHDDWLRVLTDQQGELRLALERRGNSRRYLYRDAKARTWTPLDELIKGDTSLGFAADPQTLLGRRSIPLGFDRDGVTLYFASNVDHDTFALRAIDTTTGLPTDLEIAVERADLVDPTDLIATGSLVFDPQSQRLTGVRFGGALHATVWLDGEIRQIETALSEKLAPQRCRILEWDRKRERFLLDVWSPDDPGGFYVFDRTTGKLHVHAERAPWLTEDKRNVSHSISFTKPDGVKLAGIITLPRERRVDPAPILVYFHDGPWLYDAPVFDRGVQALAGLGFAVLQINYRGSGGFGRAHLEAIRDGWELAVIDDMRTAIIRTAERFAINPHLVAAVGNGFGGYLSVRAAQLDPENIRCAVAINTPSDIETWVSGGWEGQSFRAGLLRSFFSTGSHASGLSSTVATASMITRPVLVVHAENDAYVPVSMGRAHYRALKQRVETSAYLELKGEGHGGWSEESATLLFAELGRFFNATIYDYSVELGPTVVDPSG